MNDWLKKHIDWLLAAAFAGGIFAAVTAYERPIRGQLPGGALLLASDGFFVAGVLLAGTGLLTLIAQAGGFDGLAYIFYSLGAKFNFSATDWKAKKEYAAFKRERQGRHREYRASLFTGLFCLVLAAVLALACQWF